ncbi:MAG TPA: aldo/keto reductase [Polyangiaceae bacterium]|nr:aldo/keto reductase [Polyangiaceae bacterium]
MTAPAVPAAEFSRRHVAALGREVGRLGLATNFGLPERAVSLALERGVDYFFWTTFRSGPSTRALRATFPQRREKVVLAAGTTVGWFAGTLRGTVERTLRTLGTEYLDVFQLNWLGVASSYSEAHMAELAKLRDEGKLRKVGISIHDRGRAGRLAEDSPLDLFMIRYNAAHPGAERDIFPHLERRKPAVVAYTATAWRRLLRKPSGWDGAPATAGDCYRFCLSSPHVDVVLSGPKTEEELVANLDAVARGPLTPEEDTRLRAFGQAVHG